MHLKICEICAIRSICDSDNLRVRNRLPLYTPHSREGWKWKAHSSEVCAVGRGFGTDSLTPMRARLGVGQSGARQNWALAASPSNMSILRTGTHRRLAKVSNRDILTSDSLFLPPLQQISDLR